MCNLLNVNKNSDFEIPLESDYLFISLIKI